MKALILGVLAAVLSIGAAAAQGSPESIVTVLGEATIERPADYVTITGRVVGEGLDQTAALKALSNKRDVIEDRLSRLAGAKSIAFETSDIKFQTVIPPACRSERGEDAPQLSTGPCAPTGGIATLDVTVRIHPATELGDAASLAVTEGLVDVSVGEGGLDDRAKLEQDCLRAAIENARSQAELIASASGGRLGKIQRINRGNFESELAMIQAHASPEVVVAANQRRELSPEVALKLTPPKVSASTKVVVVYGWTP